MKKVLFTLAALFAFGLTASAEQVDLGGIGPNIGIGTDANNLVTEVELAPGESVELGLVLLDMPQAMVSGFQMQFRMFDANHEFINYATDGMVICPKLYGGRVKGWLNPVGIGTSDENAGGFDGVSLANDTPYDNIYRILGTNTKYNMVFFQSDADGNPTCPAVFAKFTIKVAEDWAEEFATFELDNEYTLWNQCPEEDPAVFEEAKTQNPCILKIKNANYVPPTPDPVPLTGEITIGDADENGYVAIEYTGEEEGLTIVAMIDGVPVEIVDGKIFLGAYGEAVITVEVSGEGYITMTAQKTVNWEEPVTPEPTEVPVITYETMEDCVIITATGNGTVTMYVNNELVENPYTIMRGEEATSVIVTAYAQEEGKEMSAAATLEVPIPALEPITPPEPVVTPTPAITYEITDDAIIITATGEGEVLLYVNGELVENPCIIERGEEDVTIVVTATAQGEDMEISEVATETIVVPAKEIVTPPDPEDHNVGYWLVIFDKEGNEMWIKLENSNTEDPSGYQTNVALRYSIFGGNPNMSDDERPNVPFYFVVDGVRYGALEENMIPVYGDANQNPLNENENMWNIPVGRNYVIGIVIDPETGKMYMQISRGTYTELDELMGGKTIAGVRYFNAAGQEMQEANGLTIMIITYTDGTTIATKVIK